MRLGKEHLLRVWVGTKVVLQARTGSKGPWPGSTPLSSHPIPMFEIANGNGVLRPENYVEASLETMLPLATMMLVEPPYWGMVRIQGYFKTCDWGF